MRTGRFMAQIGLLPFSVCRLHLWLLATLWHNLVEFISCDFSNQFDFFVILLVSSEKFQAEGPRQVEGKVIFGVQSTSYQFQSVERAHIAHKYASWFSTE